MKEGKAGLLIIGPKSDDEEEPKAKDDSSKSLSATKALLRAIKDDDPEAADEALRLHYEICSMGEDYEEE